MVGVDGWIEEKRRSSKIDGIALVKDDNCPVAVVWLIASVLVSVLSKVCTSFDCSFPYQDSRKILIFKLLSLFRTEIDWTICSGKMVLLRMNRLVKGGEKVHKWKYKFLSSWRTLPAWNSRRGNEQFVSVCNDPTFPLLLHHRSMHRW